MGFLSDSGPNVPEQIKNVCQLPGHSAAGFDHLVAWRESDQGHIDVRDLISTLEALNIFDFPNDSGQHPVTAYEKWSVPAKKFAADFDRHRDSLGREPLNGDLPRRP
jgi:hypothetical protein